MVTEYFLYICYFKDANLFLKRDMNVRCKLDEQVLIDQLLEIRSTTLLMHGMRMRKNSFIMNNSDIKINIQLHLLV